MLKNSTTVMKTKAIVWVISKFFFYITGDHFAIEKVVIYIAALW